MVCEDAEFIELDRDQPSIQTPSLHVLEDDETNLSDYLEDPTDPVLCVPEQDHDHYWRLLNSNVESHLGGPGSTMNFWLTSAGAERLTGGVKMHSAAAFLSMPTQMVLSEEETQTEDSMTKPQGDIH